LQPCMLLLDNRTDGINKYKRMCREVDNMPRSDLSGLEILTLS